MTETKLNCVFIISFLIMYVFSIYAPKLWNSLPDRLRQLDRRRRLKGIHSKSDTNRTGAEGLSFYYPRLLHCLDQMLAVMSLSQHRVWSFKSVRSRTPCGARCIGHAVSTWSAVFGFYSLTGIL